jgi:pyruvate/2-oxoglutarate dehydrogenase complex dihydrolipoamide acyltransferase (E2) component
MIPTTPETIVVTVPQVNVNDEEVLLVGWRVEDGESVTEGQPLAELETSKSVDEVPAPAGGIVRRAAQSGQSMRVGAVLAYIGPSVEAIDAYLTNIHPSDSRDDQPALPRITAGARLLARRYGIDPLKIPAAGEALRREDVERFARDLGLPAAVSQVGDEVTPRAASDRSNVTEESIPPVLLEKVGAPQELSDHQWAVAQHLARTRARLVPAQVAMDMPMDRASDWMEARRKAGTMTNLLPLVLGAAGAAISAYPVLASFRLGRRVYPYRSIDVAFTARSRDGRLFTPVVRGVDQLTPDGIIGECARLTMALYRGQLRAEDLSGGCLTVSLLDQQPVLFHVGLQNAYQSAVLTMGATREQVVWRQGQAVPRMTATMVLSYDHGLLDGWDASAFLEHMRKRFATLETT